MVSYVCGGLALAAPGDLDPTFSGSGLLVLSITPFESSASAVLQQDDGKPVIAGYGEFDASAGYDFIAARVLEDGTPDGTFGTDGVAKVDFGGTDDIARAVIQQTDGKLVLAGSTSNGRDIGLARFTAAGSPDPTFGDGGTATLDIDGKYDFASGLVVQSSGKLVIAGATGIPALLGFPSTFQLVFARFDADGQPDLTFGTGGTTIIDFGKDVESRSNQLVQQPDGKLLAVGQVLNPTGQDVALVRVTEEGLLDPSFDSDGLLTVDVNGGDEAATSAAVQSDGSIVVAGYTTPPGADESRALLLRVTGAGTLDESFGAGNKSVIDLGSASILNSIIVQADGKLLGTGARARSADAEDLILARFESDGRLDTSYGVSGAATADFGAGDMAHVATGVALIRQADGKHVVAAPNSTGRLSAARFDDVAAFAGRIGLTRTDAQIAETAGSVSYTARRTGGRTGAISVDYATSAGEAEPGSDFEAASGVLVWNDGDVGDQTITVNLIDDAEVESNELFSLTLSAPTGGAQLAASTARTTIASDDGPGQLAFLDGLTPIQVSEVESVIQTIVRRTGGWTGAVSVRYAAVSGSAAEGQDFVSASGTLSWSDGDTASKLISVEILDDTRSEGPEDFQIRLSDPSGGATISSLGEIQFVRILDDDSPGGGGGGGGDGGGDGGGGGGGGGAAGAADVLAGLAALSFWRRRRQTRFETRGERP